jgi:hypothetical protein
MRAKTDKSKNPKPEDNFAYTKNGLKAHHITEDRERGTG